MAAPKRHNRRRPDPDARHNAGLEFLVSAGLLATVALALTAIVARF